MGERQVLETRLADELPAVLAHAVSAVVDAREGLVDLLHDAVLGIDAAEVLEAEECVTSVLVLAASLLGLLQRDVAKRGRLPKRFRAATEQALLR